MIATVLIGFRAPAGEIAGLGSVEFATSCGSKAQEHFVTGLAALHSFWYEKARDEFQAAYDKDPRACTISLWGLALTYNYPIWAKPQDLKSATSVLQKLPAELEHLKPEEKGLIESLRSLFDESQSWDSRVSTYSQKLAELHHRFPDHFEIGAFYALSLQDIKVPKNLKHSRLMTAGALGLELLKLNPRHPGALHYTIHAFDDPVHAPLALPAAHTYADVSPSSSHALHMPGHIFVQLGLWEKALRVNQRSWDVSNNQDWHTLSWLNYIYLQLGQFKKSAEILELTKKASQKHHHLLAHYFEMAAFHVIEGQLWSEAKTLLSGYEKIEASGMEYSQARLAHALAAYHTKDSASLKALSKSCAKTLAQKSFTGTSSHYDLQIRNAAQMCLSLYDFSRGRQRKAHQRLDELSLANSSEYLAYGIPFEVVPIDELRAYLLFSANEPLRAWSALEASFAKFSGRSRALHLASEIRRKLKDDSGAEFYRSRFSRNWQEADSARNKDSSQD